MTVTPEVPPEGFNSYEAAFSGRLRAWQQFFGEAPAEAIAKQSVEAVTELNELLPYRGEECDYCGHVEATVYEEATDSYKRISDDAFEGTGKLVGISLIALSNEDRPRLYYQFTAGTIIDMQDPTHAVTDQLYAFLDTDGTFMPMSRLDAPFEQDMPPETRRDGWPQQRLSEASDSYVRLLRSARFKALDAQGQKDLVDKMIVALESEVDIREIPAFVEGDYCCRSRINPDGTIGTEVIPIKELVLEGLVMGLSTLDRPRLERGKPIRRVADSARKTAGLCLLLELANSVPEAALTEGEVVFVPVSDQELGVVLRYPPADANLN